MTCLVFCCFILFKQLWRVATMALKPLNHIIRNLKTQFFLVARVLEVKNQSFNNSVVFRLAHHLYSSTSLV